MNEYRIEWPPHLRLKSLNTDWNPHQRGTFRWYAAVTYRVPDGSIGDYGQAFGETPQAAIDSAVANLGTAKQRYLTELLERVDERLAELQRAGHNEAPDQQSGSPELDVVAVVRRSGLNFVGRR